MSDPSVKGHIFPDESNASSGGRMADLVWGSSRQTLEFRDLDGRALGDRYADAYVLGSLLLWMTRGGAVHVHGAVSRTLLSNLDEWQAAVRAWLPTRYHPVAFTADEVVDLEATPAARAIAAYSGGLDAMFTAVRHTRGLLGWRTEALDSLLLVHGFDIPLDRPSEFERTRERAAVVARQLDLELRTVRTNFRDVNPHWQQGHGLALAATLQLHAPEFGVGIVGSSAPYSRLRLPWGSNPLTDPLMSSATMRIRHDGAEFTRIDKARVIAGEPDLLSSVRVCWAGEELSRNCGRCEKCVRTYWMFHIVGTDAPACFDDRVTVRPSDVRMSDGTVGPWREMLRAARSANDIEATRFITAVLRHKRIRVFGRRIARLPTRILRTPRSGSRDEAPSAH